MRDGSVMLKIYRKAGDGIEHPEAEVADKISHCLLSIFPAVYASHSHDRTLARCRGQEQSLHTGLDVVFVCGRKLRI